MFKNQPKGFEIITSQRLMQNNIKFQCFYDCIVVNFRCELYGLIYILFSFELVIISSYNDYQCNSYLNHLRDCNYRYKKTANVINNVTVSTITKEIKNLLIIFLHYVLKGVDIRASLLEY